MRQLPLQVLSALRQRRQRCSRASGVLVAGCWLPTVLQLCCKVGRLGVGHEMKKALAEKGALGRQPQAARLAPLLALAPAPRLLGGGCWPDAALLLPLGGSKLLLLLLLEVCIILGLAEPRLAERRARRLALAAARAACTSAQVKLTGRRERVLRQASKRLHGWCMGQRGGTRAVGGAARGCGRAGASWVRPCS